LLDYGLRTQEPVAGKLFPQNPPAQQPRSSRRHEMTSGNPLAAAPTIVQPRFLIR
jgi:hypothetical protein